MPVSRCGTFIKSISMPVPPREAISHVEQVNPAAPMSWIATTAPVFIASMQASSSNFSMNGSPTCTFGRFCCDSSVNSAEASSDAP